MARIVGMILAVMMMICPSWGETLRVISLYPGHSDNIYAMGGSEILVALSENDDDDLLPGLPRISLRSGAERILALRPDVVITRPFAERINPNMYDVLRRSGVNVISLDPPEWDSFPEYLHTLANALNLNPDEAISRLDSIRGEISREAMNANHPRVFLEATSRELHTCPPGSWAARLIELAGGVNIAGDAVPLRPGSAIAPYGVERVLRNAASLDVYIIQNGAMNTATLKDFHAREWSGALRHVKVYEIPERYMSRPSLLGLEKGGRELLRIFKEAGR
ncbi:MAG: ABC transporter substrate-binding protein [Synergistaceae bacterium]|nr:ABC transporter substrate-binding protein [Synergistaceae bacterium]